VPAVALTVRFNDSLIILSVPVSGNTFFSNYNVYVWNFHYRSDRLLSDHAYLPGAWFVYNMFSSTLVQAFQCLNVRSVRNKVAAIHDVIADNQLEFLAPYEKWIRLDDTLAIANDTAPEGFIIVNVARCRASARSSTSLDTNGQQTKRWRRPGCQLP